MQGPKIAQNLANLESWLETMRQRGGYGGPVAHWWQNRYRYTGPGLDWRYEGILAGYALLQHKTGSPQWEVRLKQAATDLLTGQQPDGSYRASRFEMNPGTLGTPHEAAATAGLLAALPYLDDPDHVLLSVKQNLDNLIKALWDGKGFNDTPTVCGRVPNKLATLAQTLLMVAQASGDSSYLRYAQSALEDVLRFQVQRGRYAGAVHQYAEGAKEGDGRFFPYYAARCVPPLVLAQEIFGEARYGAAAEGILHFLQNTMAEDGSWPQIVYATGGRAAWPRWLAGCADILLAFHKRGAALPEVALERLLAQQLPSGAFPTASGFSGQLGQRPSGSVPDYRDVTPVVGWNDKVFRLLAELLEPGTQIPEARTGALEARVVVGRKQATFHEDRDRIVIRSARGELLYAWDKREPWAQTVHAGVDIR